MYNYLNYMPMPIPNAESPANQHGIGYDRSSRYDRFQFHVPKVYGHPSYIIDRNGVVYNYDDTSIVEPIDRDTIILDGERCNIDRLLLYSFVGFLPLDVIPRDRVPNEQRYIGRRCSALTYHFDHIRRLTNEPTQYALDKVLFKRVPFQAHEILASENGVLYNATTGEFMLKTVNLGYYCVTLAIRNQYTMSAPNIHQSASLRNGGTIKLNVLMYVTYHGEIPIGMQVDHIDNNKLNDSANNLQLLTAVDNSRKSRTEGARVTGFTYDMNETIVRMLSEGKTNAEIAAALGLGYTDRHDKHRIATIVNKLRTLPGYYDDLRKQYGIDKYDKNNSYPYKRLTDDEAAELKRLSAEGMSGIALAQKFGVSRATVSMIINGKRKPHVIA